TFALAPHVISHHQFGRACNHDLLTLGAGHVAHVAGEPYRTGRLRLDAAGGRRPRSRATHVEGPHRQLGTGFADRLSRDHTHGLSGIDLCTTTQVATIALAADAVAGFAGQCGAHLDFVDAEAVD